MRSYVLSVVGIIKLSRACRSKYRAHHLLFARMYVHDVHACSSVIHSSLLLVYYEFIHLLGTPRSARSHLCVEITHLHLLFTICIDGTANNHQTEWRWRKTKKRTATLHEFGVDCEK